MGRAKERQLEEGLSLYVILKKRAEKGAEDGAEDETEAGRIEKGRMERNFQNFTITTEVSNCFGVSMDTEIFYSFFLILFFFSGRVRESGIYYYFL